MLLSSPSLPGLVVETNEPFYDIHWYFNSGSPAAISQIGLELNPPLRKYQTYEFSSHLGSRTFTAIPPN